MKKPLNIPRDTLERQLRASDPRNSAWVSANAGSGKTHVLSQRVVRLLLGGADPSRILCLTYTRAAAANMANRVFSILSSWTMMPDEELAKTIEQLEGRRPDATTLARARKLFARALETPGGLKVQTIHAFCESVLHQFPLEANIAAHFQMLDSRMEEALFAEARLDMISGTAGDGDVELAEAFATVLDRGGEFGLDRLLAEIVSKRAGLLRFTAALRAAAPDPWSALFAEFGFTSDDSAESIADAVWPLPGFDDGYFRAFDDVGMRSGASTIVNSILPEARLAFREADPVRRLEHLGAGFLKTDGLPYGERAFTKALVAALPDVKERYTVAAERIIAVSERLALWTMLDGTKAALVVADAMVGRYERLKAAGGFLDFNDLIARTVRLLERPDAGPWVQYKLDKGIDHILLDEAQDTSPDQWRVVQRLAGEFFAGAGARDVERTIFAVGDEKQSIYSFQGARPESFAENGEEFTRLVRDAERNFESVNLKLSFRSTEDVLKGVDAVFAVADNSRGVTSEFPIEHEALRLGDSGYVEVWPSLGAETVEEPEDWRLPIDHERAPTVRIAERVASTIEAWLKSGAMLEGQGRRLKPGDIMVLVRKRDSFVHALSRSLKNRDIAVAGADRLRLPSHIAIQDLIALGRALVQPHDDLSLAAVLKSPVFDLAEDELMEIATSREKHETLMMALARRAKAQPLLAEIVVTLEEWANSAAFKPPFEFYAGVLAGTPERVGVRRKLIGRLGHEVGEIIDEFLAFTLAEEQVGVKGLEAFLVTMATTGPEIKREMDQKRDEVRIMTVHASKGLEAPVVFLVDSGSAPVVHQHLPQLAPVRFTHSLPDQPGYLWRSSKAVANSVTAAAEDAMKQAADDEYRRLLYVGMTRAEDRLILCGYHGRRPREDTWHARVTGALAGSPYVTEFADPDDPERKILRFKVTPGMANDGEPEPSPSADAALPMPAGLLTPLPKEDGLPQPLTPSGASLMVENAPQPVKSKLSPVLDATDEPGLALARGSAMHKLLQMLPDLPEAGREAAARRYLGRVGAAWPEQERDAAWFSVRRILADDRFAPLFAPGSRAEASIMGRVPVRGTPRMVSGTIDRLAVTDGELLVVDYKTNRPPPNTVYDVPEAYILQMALYAALLEKVYPGKTIRAALLFTETPALIELPAELLAESLARLSAA